MSRSIGISDHRADVGDAILVVLFLLGIYLGLRVNLAAGVPVPSVLSGIAGMALLLRHVRRIQQAHVVALLAVLLLYLVSVLSAANYEWLFERFKGYVQLAYSLIIGYAFFIAALSFDRNRLAHIFLGFCLAMVVGCALENYTGFKAVSDSFRSAVFEQGVYSADLRDEVLYGEVRPKLFTSEPSAVSGRFTLFAFAWVVLSTWRLKLLGYFALLAAGFFLMRGPTLLLGFLLLIPYELFLASRTPAGRYNHLRLFATFGLAVVLLVAFFVVGTTLYEERISQIARGGDISFFTRVVAPILVAQEVVALHPIAGAGLTGTESVADTVIQVFETSAAIPAQRNLYTDDLVSTIMNPVWLHWTYFGVVWGVAIFAALTWFIRMLGTPSILFSAAVWIGFSVKGGSYVGPDTWLTLYLSCALAVLHQRQAGAALARPRPLRWARPRGSPFLRPIASRSDQYST